jgi:cation:H+ antiporter
VGFVHQELFKFLKKVFMSILLLLLGLTGLWLGTEFSLRGAIAIAQRIGLSEFIVGVAILSIGSDIPELAIAIDGAFRILQNEQLSGVIIGSALGSGLSQIGLVLGFTGLLGYLTLPREITYQHGGLMLGSLVLLGLFGFDGRITRIEGIALIIIYAVYLAFLFSDRSQKPVETDTQNIGLGKSIVFLVSGLVVVFLSAEITISSVMQVANSLNIDKTLIAIIVVGLGTSLPELSISLGAVLKGKSRMSVGNLIGSNIFDTLMPVGVAATISELEFNPSFLSNEIPVLFLLSALVLIFFIRKKGIQKREAVTILVLYFTYVVFKLITV